MLCYVMLCYVMLCYVMLCYVMLCYVMLSRTKTCELLSVWHNTCMWVFYLVSNVPKLSHSAQFKGNLFLSESMERENLEGSKLCS